MTRLVSLVLLGPLVASVQLSAAAPTDPQVAQILEAAREAIGGPEALAGIQALSVSGEHRRVVGERELAGDLTLELLVPDKLRRIEEMGIPGGPGVSRTTVLNGDAVSTDSTSRGGRGFMRFGGPGADGPAGGRELTGEDRARMREMQARRLRQELARLQFAWLLRSTGPVAHVATAEAEDGRADVLEMKTEDGRPVRLFIDQVSHRPLMLTYETAMPRMRMRARGGQRPTAGEIERMRREPPQIVTFEMRFDDYRPVDGVLLPHLITQSTGGDVIEEWTIEKVRVNPSFEPDAFDVKESSD